MGHLHNGILLGHKKEESFQTSGQGGGVGRYILPPHTAKRRTTTNLKTKNNQYCQKNKLYGSPTTKKLKKKHSFKLVQGAKMGSRGQRGHVGRQWL